MVTIGKPCVVSDVCAGDYAYAIVDSVDFLDLVEPDTSVGLAVHASVIKMATGGTFKPRS
jgi:hypothetical protein